MLFSIPAKADASERSDDVDAVPSVSQYLLVCGATSRSLTEGEWQFSLETNTGELVLEASDRDGGDLNRLSVMAALRGLEAIDGASSVTLLSNNRYLIRSLTDSLPRWRRNQFAWEHFGRRIDVQHADLWRRVDRALSIHRVEACLVSSRVVSVGRPPVREPDTAPVETDRPVSTRIDAGHPNLPRPKRRRGHRPEPTLHDRNVADRTDSTADWNSEADGTRAVTRQTVAAELPDDRLRRWLLSTDPAAGVGGGSRRFTTADLLGSTG